PDGGTGVLPQDGPSSSREVQLARHITKGKKNRRVLSNKPQDFQIRVRVIEGRQLSGNNIKPVVKVHICGQTHRTRIKRGNNPYFDEVKTLFPHHHNLQEIKININMIDLASMFMFNVLSGHAVMRKWLLLNDPEDTNSSPKGYLKVSMFVLGTGDEPPVSVLDNENDDVETNLLLPAGIVLRWVTFVLKIYRAEDIPQMDDAFAQTVKEIFGGEADKKNLVDPFVEVCFAGKKVLCASSCIVYSHFPSMCEKIRLMVYDWDRLTKNDVVGTTYLCLSKIAASGGEVEGKPVSFLTVDSVSSISKPICLLILQKYQRRRKYSLCAVFHSATMLQDIGEPIQFEVSIGNYGNKFDNTCKPLASTTQYSRAIFDGNYYYYLPWANTKPVVTLTSYWEDISHRLDPLNLILAMIVKLVKGKQNVTILDTQILKLRVKSLHQIQEAAIRLRNEAMDVKATLPNIEDWLDKLMQLTEEPQNSMPDVFIWMIRGEKRLAYARVPAHEILHSTCPEASGKYCGKTQTIFLKYPQDKNNIKIPAQLRVNFWLGLTAVEKKFNSFAEGAFSVFAELYENQALMFGKWGTRGLVGRHKFSDVTGKIKLKREYFLPPKGWEWEDEWFVDPERSLLTEADAGHTEFTDEVYQNESRYPGGEWKAAEDQYTDVNGEKAPPPGEISCPPGWIWDDEAWIYDINRAVDEKGWEYGITIPPDNKPKSWGAAEKMYHTHRRRRLVRKRRKDPNQTTCLWKRTEGEGNHEGWEFASLIGWKFHWKQRSSDTFRRRRWRRKMAPSDTHGAAAIFKLEGALVNGDHTSEKSTDSAANLFGANTPIVSCNFDSNYHLRCYVYQARNLTALDKDSFSDPYAHVSFLHRSKTTEIIHSTLNPTWDQTIIFDEIEIYGDPQMVAQSPPQVVVELFDNDQVGKDEFLGRTFCSPMVKLNPDIEINPKLLWYPVKNGGKVCGDVLLAAELILIIQTCIYIFQQGGTNLPILPSQRAPNLYMVPQGIRPVVQLTAIEILAWGLRNMKNYQMASVTSPSLIIECGGVMIESVVIKNLRRTPNFPGSVLFMKVLLPKEELYTPSLVLKVIDHRQFGRKPIVGQCTIDFLERFRCDPYATKEDIAPQMKVTILAASPCRDVVIEVEDAQPLLTSQVNFLFTYIFLWSEKEVVDWWSKFYASIGDTEKCGQYVQKGYDTLKVYNCELENVPDFQGLTDFCDTFKLYRGKNEENDDPMVAGEFKGSFRIYTLPDDPTVPPPPRQFCELPDSGPQECIVRIYVVRGLELQPKDNNGLCDPYIKISLGKKIVEDRDHYIPNTLNPIFGRMYELSCFLPQEKDLKISVYDYDLMTRDEKVGETTIDLENRFLSRFGSHCGIPQQHCVSGINTWRDQLKPTQLFTLCREFLVIFIVFFHLISEVNKILHEHLGPGEERLALHILRTQGLVPEHVETRTLYSTFQPNIPQGKLQMWVDVFPKSLGPPGPPFNITPRQAKKYELRVIIWNTKDVILDEKSITGEEMSDIYVKGWMPGHEDYKQKTDVHYRSLDGEGNFNWRFIFPFDYFPAEQLCTVSKKVWTPSTVLKNHEGFLTCPASLAYSTTPSFMEENNSDLIFLRARRWYMGNSEQEIEKKGAQLFPLLFFSLKAFTFPVHFSFKTTTIKYACHVMSHLRDIAWCKIIA
uniref:Myoferlin n=1 Tax=Laticauda laticaudata TaxID=8630 RepID=A0A8C5RHE0_LATLA